MIHYNHAVDVLLQRHVPSYKSMYLSAQVMPGYPLFLAACKWIAGSRWIVGFGQSGLPGLRFIVLVHGILSVIGTLVVYAVARRVRPPLWAGMGALLWTVYLPQAHASTTILTESLYTCLPWLFMWLVIRAAERPTSVSWHWPVFVSAHVRWCGPPRCPSWLSSPPICGGSSDERDFTRGTPWPTLVRRALDFSSV